MLQVAEKKRFVHNTDIGQNFLIDESLADFITERARLSGRDVVLEIGPGDGVLTRALLRTPLKRLYALEVDERLRERLENIASHDGRCRPIFCDALRFDYESGLGERPSKIVANLPYHITTPLIWTFLERLAPRGMDYMLLMLQLEAAERVVSLACRRERSPLGITAEAMGSAAVLRKVPPAAFHPRPKVMSAVVEIKIEKNADIANDSTWRSLLARSFTQRRKTLCNNWCASCGMTRESALRILSRHSLKPTARAEELPLEKWFELAQEPAFVLKNSDNGERNVLES
mgnify:CR=1 FL=1